MICLFADIDNTLIFSHRHNYEPEKVIVEYLNGKEQSYIKKDLFDYLRTSNFYKVIPVTSRSESQSRRLFKFWDSLGVENILACNGGVLLTNGKRNADWEKETLDFCHKECEEVERILKFVEINLFYGKLNCDERFMFYFSTSNVIEQFEKIKSIADDSKVFIGKDNRKVYVIAKSINKGTSVERYCKNYNIKNYIVAGDSEFDISMMKNADYVIADGSLKKCIYNDKIYFSRTNQLAMDLDEILMDIQKEIEKNERRC